MPGAFGLPMLAFAVAVLPVRDIFSCGHSFLSAFLQGGGNDLRSN